MPETASPLSAKELLVEIIKIKEFAYFIKKYFFQAVILMQGQEKPVQEHLAKSYANHIIASSDRRIKFCFMMLSGRYSISAQEQSKLYVDLFDLLKASIIYSARHGKYYSSLLPLIEKKGGYDFARRFHNRGLAFVANEKTLARIFDKKIFARKWLEIDKTLPQRVERKNFPIPLLNQIFTISLLLLFIYQQMMNAEVSLIQLLIMAGLLALSVTYLSQNLCMPVVDAIRRNKLEHELLEIKVVGEGSEEQARSTRRARSTASNNGLFAAAPVAASSQNFVIEVSLTPSILEAVDSAAAAEAEVVTPSRKPKRWHKSAEESMPVAEAPQVRPLRLPGDFGAEFEELPANQLVKIQGQGLSANATLYGIWHVEENDEALDKLFTVFEKAHTVGKIGSGIKKLTGEVQGYEIKDSALPARVIGYREIRAGGNTAIIFEDYKPDGIHSSADRNSAVQRSVAVNLNRL